MKRHGLNSLFAVAALALTASLVMAEAPVDPALPIYQRVEGLEGKITLIGSDTLSQLAGVWRDSFRQLYPGVEIDITVKGSANAVGSVINGEANFGLLSRPITEQEVADFRAKLKNDPTLLIPALEPIAIFVHKDNPIKELTLAQLDAIFSASRKRGAAKTVTTWGDLGLAGKWATTPISCQIRNDSTGSQVFFQTYVLGGGDFRQGIVRNDSNLDLVKAVAGNPGAIGFAGSIHAIPEVKAVPLAWKEGDPALDLHTLGYPLVRPLQIVVNTSPSSPMPKVQQEFLKYIFSRRGQQDVIIGGFTPIPAKPAQLALDAIGVKILN